MDKSIFEFKTLEGKLINNKGEKISLKPNEQEMIGLYFSAHWCPPCKGFTPVFAKYYKKMKADEGKNFEVVFISSDQDEGQFKEYFKEMPWLALDFNERETKKQLAEFYGITGIPTLVILNPDGSLNRMNGREMVTKNEYITDSTQQKK